MPLPRRGQTSAADNRSAAESFYGGPARQSTSYAPVEPTPEDDPFTPPPPRNRRDSASTFFGRNELGGGDGEEHEMQSRPSGGRNSLYGQPRQEPVKYNDDPEDGGDGFDIYADFNNAGPRYSGAQNLNSIGKAGPDGYHTLQTPEGSKVGIDEQEPVELVTVPRFGPEWSKAELRQMTKKGRAEDEAFDREQRWREWNLNKRGLWGSKWLTRKVIVWTLFFSSVFIGVMLAILLPRAPSFGFNPVAPITAGKGIPNFSRGPPATFAFNATLDLEMDTSGNIIPLYTNNIHASIYLSDTQQLIAAGDVGGFWRRPGKAEPLGIPVFFSYTTDNSSDSTWNIMHNACEATNLYASGVRPNLNVLLILELSLRGMPGKAGASTSITNLACPITLPSNE